MPLNNYLASSRVISEQLEFINKSIAKLEKDQRNAPKGIIRLQSSKGYPRYYYFKNKSDTKGQYLSADNINLIQSICQRDYNLKLLDKLCSMQKSINSGKEINFYGDIDEVYYSFPTGKQSLITPIIPVMDTYIEQWKTANPSSQNEYEIKNGIYTNNNELVRSKSEKIIADRLTHFDIPYVYEPRLIINSHLKYPDFLVLNKRTRQSFIWEHFGLVDDELYSDKNLLKLSLYESAGYFLGKDLICSFESTDSAIDSKIIDDKIKAFLL